jgi:lipopolysaccharide export system protein LptC
MTAVTANTHSMSMDLWRPRRTLSLRGARFHTGFVHILRLLFTVAAMVSAGFLIGPVIDHSLHSTRPVANPGVSSVTMLGPRFTGRDANDKPFVITADTARRRPEKPSLVDLTNPRMEDETASNVVARNGVYDEVGEVLDLAGDVVMTDASGYVFNSETARMFVRENRIEGQTRLTGTGPMGELKADTYKVLDNGKRIILNGNVWTKIIVDDKPK